MPPAAKHFDPILGIDVHIVQPPGPVPPVPVPHPHTGMVLDPCDYAPWIGGTVKVGGLQRAQAGTETMMIPKHIPIGGVFVKPPGSEGEIFMGSSTVAVDGDAFTYLALPVLTCQDVGIPAPGRPKGSPPKSLVLPTTVVLSIPLPVNVGGSPTVSLMALGMRAGMAALGAALKKLKGLAKNSDKMKKVSSALHNKAAKVMDDLRIPPNIRNKVHDGICSVTGHPVDIATGKLFTRHRDFEIPGPVPFGVERIWNSTSRYEGPLGHGWHADFDESLWIEDGFVLRRGPDGRGTVFPDVAPGETHYDTLERLTLGRDADGYWTRDSEGVTSRFLATGGRHRAEHVLARRTSALGHHTRYYYDHRGRLARVVDASGRAFAFTADDRDRIVRIDGPHPDDPAQQRLLVRYEYDAAGDLVAAADALGQTWRFLYRDHLLVREVDPRGFSFYFEFDGRDHLARCIRTWGDGGIYDRRLRYDDLLDTTSVIDSTGAETTYVHDGVLATEILYPDGSRCRLEYDEDHRLVGEVDELGARVQYAYDERGNVVKTTYPDGACRTYAYDDGDRPTAVTNEAGATWAWRYDEDGRVVERHEPGGAVTRYRYRGPWLVAIVDPGEHEWHLGYDRWGNFAQLRRPNGTMVSREFDALSRPIRAVDANGNEVRRTFDAVGRMIRQRGPDGDVAELEYDPVGNNTRVVDGSREITATYAGMGRMIARTENGATIRYEYDREERLTSIVDALGRTHSYAIDSRGFVVGERTFDGVERRFVRDAAGCLLRVDEPGARVTEYEYDAAGAMVGMRCSDGYWESYAYRADGELMVLANPSTTVRYERDDCGRVLAETQGPHRVESAYDLRGDRVRLTTSLGADRTLDRDAMGDVTRLREGRFETAFVRDGLGLEIDRLLPGSVRRRSVRDPLGRPTRMETHVGASLRGAVDLQWEPRDRLRRATTETDAVEYHHDRRGTLVAARHRDGRLELRVADRAGNLYRREDRSDRTYGGAGQLLESRDERGVTTYRYDEIGNLAGRIDPDGGQWSYRWNGAGQLVQVVRPDGDAVDFAYDALGRRVRKTFGERTTWWVWDGDDPIHEWTEIATATGSAREPAITWVFDPDGLEPLARVSGDEWLSIATNHLGVPTDMLDERGRAVWSAEIDIYGEARAIEGPRDACPFRFPGQYEDAETGLYYNRFRYYDPRAGVYISRDPLGLEGGINTFAYVDDPLVAVDPLGLFNKYRRKNGQFGKKPGPDPKPKPSMNGNSANSPKPAVLYAQYDDQGDFQKWGITQEVKDPKKRYPKLPKDWDVDPKAKGSRKDMLALERELVEKDPGKLNKEPWAGKKKGQPMSPRAAAICAKK